MKTELQRIVIMGEGCSVIYAHSLEEALDLAFSVVEDKNLIDRPLRGILGNLFQRQAARPQNPMQGAYESHVSIPDGDAAFDSMAEVVALASVAAGVTARIWEHSVPPRYMKVWGSGTYGAINNQGYGFFVIHDVGGAVPVQNDLVSLLVESYDKHRIEVVKEFNDGATHLTDSTSLVTLTPSNNQTNMLALPMTTIIAGPYSRLAINIKVIVAATAPDSAGFRFPVSVKSG